MRIQHNIAALNSHRNLTNNNSAVAKNLEKLSSGYRINRAGDDAAGLAISEKMRAQITGLETAQKNAQDGISLVQTAEGALTEVHSMLNRMVELADQSANGTYDNEVDRANLQKEISSLKDEIDRIAEATNFNGINLLDGSMGGAKAGTAPKVITDWATTPAMTQVEASAGTFTGITAKAAVGEATYEVQYTDAEGNSHTTQVKFTAQNKDKEDGEALAKAIQGNSELSSLFDVSENGSGVITLTAKDKGTKAAVVNQMGLTGGSTVVAPATVTKGKDAGVTLSAGMNAGDSITVDGKTYMVTGGTTNAEAGKFTDEAAVIAQLKKDGYKVVDSTGADATSFANATITADPNAEGKGLTLQIGDTADDFNQLTVKVGDMHATALGIGDINISTQDGAKAAVQKIKDAINTVSSTRGDLGAIQNRLEHTINNLSVTTENMTAAESRIRDVDMAKEMMAYTKNNILVQASQAMLAQANQLPQGVLQLLQ